MLAIAITDIHFLFFNNFLTYVIITDYTILTEIPFIQQLFNSLTSVLFSAVFPRSTFFFLTSKTNCLCLWSYVLSHHKL